MRARPARMSLAGMHFPERVRPQASRSHRVSTRSNTPIETQFRTLHGLSIPRHRGSHRRVHHRPGDRGGLRPASRPPKTGVPGPGCARATTNPPANTSSGRPAAATGGCAGPSGRPPPRPGEQHLPRGPLPADRPHTRQETGPGCSGRANHLAASWHLIATTGTTPTLAPGISPASATPSNAPKASSNNSPTSATPSDKPPPPCLLLSTDHGESPRTSRQECPDDGRSRCECEGVPLDLPFRATERPGSIDVAATPGQRVRVSRQDRWER